MYNNDKQTNKKNKTTYTLCTKVRITPLQKHCNKRNVETTSSSAYKNWRYFLITWDMFLNDGLYVTSNGTLFTFYYYFYNSKWV